MEYYSNKGKNIEILVDGSIYKRHAIKTKFVNPGDDYISVVKEYVSNVYQEGDIISISEKIIALCQNRIVRKEDMKISILAKILCKFASNTAAGPGVSEVYKMQYAINIAGSLKVLFASIASAVTKLFGIKGVFYKIVGQDVAGLDGFYDKVWKEYGQIGIELPENPNEVCNEIKEKLGISCMIVDANDLGQDLLGCSYDLIKQKQSLIKLISDNPAGQGDEQTPIILIRNIQLAA